MRTALIALAVAMVLAGCGRDDGTAATIAARATATVAACHTAPAALGFAC